MAKKGHRFDAPRKSAKAKAAGKKKAVVKKAAKKQSRKEVEAALKGPVRRAVKPRPQTPRLPGVEEGRIPELSQVCSKMADLMHAANETAAAIKELNPHALFLMQKHKTNFYREHGVELSRVPGDEKLRKKLTDGSDSTSELRMDGPTFGETVDNGAGDEDAFDAHSTPVERDEEEEEVFT